MGKENLNAGNKSDKIMENISDIKAAADKIIKNISKVIVGKEEVIKLILTSVAAGGHVLIEDNPGTGKTMLAKALAKSIDCDFKRVQFTPDLMPSDITGLNIFNQKDIKFELVKGPVFTNILLADEINRATPRTQSSLLEAMEEHQVTIDGNTMKLEEPFFVIATENPLETTGTYPLPEAQLDRFIMKLSMGETTKTQELNIISRFIDEDPLEKVKTVCSASDIINIKNEVKKVFIHDCVREYIVDIIMKSRHSSKVAYGASSRGTLALLRCSQAYAAISGKAYVDPDIVKLLAPYVIGHRIAQDAAYGKSERSKEVVTDIVNQVSVPVENWEI